jgi:hypothetical protein
MDFVEMLRPDEQLAQDDGRPTLCEHLTGHRDGTKLTESGFHGRQRNPMPSMVQVQFLN